MRLRNSFARQSRLLHFVAKQGPGASSAKPSSTTEAARLSTNAAFAPLLETIAIGYKTQVLGINIGRPTMRKPRLGSACTLVPSAPLVFSPRSKSEGGTRAKRRQRRETCEA